ncbi:hypothetical protein EJ03DRAFT_132570 [Teratosphaeria nubilosa]|uniref:TNFR-Cys domain-containing protein n=1 Tax=Teratosphaeria nubilosa TaxID=161662 RepID=A0A6G1LKN6_9PEZI|nr:hypothetical protein EJ03DRAFT_132570 [Teratosphaeria nubilosa]
MKFLTTLACFVTAAPYVVGTATPTPCNTSSSSGCVYYDQAPPTGNKDCCDCCKQFKCQETCGRGGETCTAACRDQSGCKETDKCDATLTLDKCMSRPTPAVH